MQHRRVRLLLLSLLLSVPAFARVISYAPYTDRVADPAIQARTARHFVLIETAPERFNYPERNDLVLYDSTGAEEPRIITPEDDELYFQSALYQKPGEAPVILAIGGRPYYSAAQSLYVSDGGNAWTEVRNIGLVDWAAVLDVDTGGPFARGPFAPIMIGNDAWPFVATIRGNGVWAISRTGTAKRMFAAGARVIGRNAAGDRFLVHFENALWVKGVDGEATKLAGVPSGPYYAGWLTANGTPYVQTLSSAGRHLFTIRNGALQLIAGDTPALPPVVHSPSGLVKLKTFAVPTHDFEGAWLVERVAGAPTTLRRHTPASGLQTMWSDASAPEIEALIAGESGETLLLQVHRERKGAELATPFLDPALAVWRIGQPAPREYEELYVNESWNKGFVLVDVDRLESGKPFVFNSGYQIVYEPSQSRVSAPILSADVMQEWGVVRGSFRQRLVLPGVARLRGAYNSFWQTDLTIHNPLDEPQQVEVRFVPLGRQESITATLTLEAQELRAIPDALHSLFFVTDGGGTLHLLPAIGVNATSRTYSRRADGGTYGFGMGAIDFFNAAGPRFPISFAGAFPREHFRTNVLLTDTSGRGAEVKLDVMNFYRWQRQGMTPVVGALAQSTVQIDAGAVTGLKPGERGGLVIETTRGTVIPTVVAIDNRSNDPTYFPPDLRGAVPRAIPVIGHLDGANGAQFRSDLYLYNPRDTTRSIDITLRKWDSPAPRQRRLMLFPLEARAIDDVMRTLFGETGVGHLTFANPDFQVGDAVRVTSRTYTVDAETGATYGCLVPPLTGFQIAGPGDALEILGISAGPGFRTNVGLVHLANLSAAPMVRLTLLGDRKELDSLTGQIPERGGLQLNDMITARGIAPPPAARLRIEVLSGEQVAAYATLTDNRTNDSTYLGTQLVAKVTN